MTWMIYGASGYTGSNTAERAVANEHRPVLAGRSAEKVRAIAEPLGLDWRAFDLDDPRAVDRGLEGIHALLNCAGPFFRTSEQMIGGCLRTQTHYLDVTGEIDVFERCSALTAEAERAGIMLMPGVGFDQVPGDGLALHLQRQLPDATWLDVAFRYAGPMTRGSAKTAFLLFSQGALVRREHRLIAAPPKTTKKFDFGDGPTLCTAITFGDLAVSYRTTGIPNITAYTSFNKVVGAMVSGSTRIAGLIARPRIARAGEAMLDRLPQGPDEDQLKKFDATLVAEARNDAGQVRRSRLRLPNVYALTFDLGHMISAEVALGRAEPGYRTPAQIFGPDYVLSAPGCFREDLPT